MDETLIQLKEKERSLLRNLQSVRAAIAAFEKSQLSLQSPDTTTKTITRQTRTIKQDAMRVLNRYPNGRTARQILNELNRTVRPELERETLSPQLSRLRREGKLAYDKGVWSIADGDANDLLT